MPDTDLKQKQKPGLAELAEAINSIRRNPGFMGNAVFYGGALEALLTEPGTDVFLDKDIVVATREDRSLSRVYFFAADRAALGKLPGVLICPGRVYTADLIGRRGTKDDRPQALNELAGFELYDTFVQMTCREPRFKDFAGSADPDSVELAYPTDLGDIIRLIEGAFDEVTAHFPSEAELFDAIQKGEIYVACVAARAAKTAGTAKMREIAGMAWFEKKSPKLSILRYYVIEEKFRGRGMGASLLSYEDSLRSGSETYRLWISENNATIDLYRKAGFEYDGALDRIMVYREER